jgi:transposase
MNKTSSKTRARRTFTREYKVEAVRMVTEGGHRLSEVARDLDLAPKLIRRWRAALEQEGAESPAFPGKGHQKPEEEELRRLRRENARLQEEREILKKALAIFSGPRQP